MLSIPVVVHGGDDGADDLDIIGLVIQVEVSKAFKLAFFYKQRTFLINIPTFINDQHVLIFIGIFSDGLLYFQVVLLGGFFTDTGTITFFNVIVKALGLSRFQPYQPGTNAVFFDQVMKEGFSLPEGGEGGDASFTAIRLGNP